MRERCTPPGDRANRPEVVVLVGLQGSGKSSLYQQRFAATHARVSRDLFRNHPRAARRQRELIAEALAAGRSVVVDNTSPSVADRAAILEVAREHGARTACYFFGRDVRGAIARNAGREGRARVPVVAILAAARRLADPSPDEGFDRLFGVEPTPDGRFAVSELGARPTGRGPPWRALAVLGAHPDDETIGAGALLGRAGAALVVHLTDGAPRDARFRPEAAPATVDAYAALRRAELAAALEAGGADRAELASLGAPDQEAALHLAPLARRLARLLSERRPGVLLTQPYEGGHPDHDASALVARAAVALLRRDGLPPPRLVEMTSYHARRGALETGRFLPGGGRELVRTLSCEEQARKRRMLAAFASQRQVLAPFGVEAERFRAARPCPFASPPHDGPLWYELLGFPLTGSRWRALARSALEELGLDLLAR